MRWRASGLWGRLLSIARRPSEPQAPHTLDADPIPDEWLETVLRDEVPTPGDQPATGASPDLTHSILARVDQRCGLFCQSGMRRVFAWRWAAASAAVLLLGAGLVCKRNAPDVFSFACPSEAPIGSLVQAVPSQTAGAIQNARAAVQTFTDAVFTAPAMAVQATAQDTAWAGSGFIFSTDPAVAAGQWHDAAELLLAHPYAGADVNRFAAGDQPAPSRITSVRYILTEPGRAAAKREQPVTYRPR